MEQEYTYWMALAHTERMRTAQKNEIIVQCYERSIGLSDFFHCGEAVWQKDFQLTPEEIGWLNESKKGLPNYAFEAESLLEQGYSLIPILSSDYPKTLKQNLKKTYAPPLLYAKGSLQLLKTDSIAIVGSRQAESASLQFTDNIAKQAAVQKKVVVSGYAKGVDKQALDSSLKYGGRSIVVLPQGITTFTSGFKTLYKDIVAGNVLIVSAFHPKAPWSTGLAMARNPIIYGMAQDIYVAESADSKGGTWAGVMDGLRKMRRIYVRNPLPNEKNANHLLIEKGAIPVSLQGEICMEGKTACVSEPLTSYESLEERIRKLLKKQKLTSKEIIERLALSSWTTRKMTDFLKKMPDIEVQGKFPLKFAMKGSISNELTLF